MINTKLRNMNTYNLNKTNLSSADFKSRTNDLVLNLLVLLKTAKLFM